MVGGSNGSGLDSLSRILTGHLARYPLMQVQDVYKLLHQAALGSGHAVHNAGSARKMLERELAEMGDGPEEPLPDLITPDGALARIHLRPYLRAGKDLQVLLTAFIRTANEWRGSQEILHAYGKAAAHQAELENWPISGVEITGFFVKMGESCYPAVHHSVTFSLQYHPAYRVVNSKYMEAV